jgi:type IV secretion system protein TrbI
MADQPAPVPDVSAPPGRVTDHRRLPLGVVPRHLQQWALAGIAVVMVGILAVSGPPPTPRAPTIPSPTAMAVDPNQQRIEEYQRRIQEQAQRLAAEQAQLQLAKDALTAPPAATGGAAPLRVSAEPSGPTATPSVERASSENRSRVADNVAFSRPGTTGAGQAAPGAAAPAFDPALVLPPVPLPAGVPGVPEAVPAPTSPAQTSPVAAPVMRTVAATVPRGPQYTLYEGTIIETVLTNRLDGTFSGPVNCLVSVPVYAADHLVIPAGARVLGEARAVNTFGQSRLAVTFHRVILPNGVHVSLDTFHGLNQVGDLGLRDQVDRHYAQIFGVSLALGAIAGFAQGQSSVGLDATAVDLYRQGIAGSVSQSSARVLDRFLNLLPTVMIREGHRIKVYLSSDLELPAYRPAFPLPGGRP